MAAASVVIKAIPRNRTVRIHIDSMAAIQALNEGPVSERKRIKMQGRTWKSFIKTTIAARKRQINIVHIKSHEGLERTEQRGNNQADKLAKQFMRHSEKQEPLPYFIAGEERFLAFHQDNLIGGNIRLWLKKREEQQLRTTGESLKLKVDYSASYNRLKLSPN